MQDLFDLLHSIPYRFGYLILDFFSWVLSLFPSVPFDLQGLVDSFPIQALQLLAYCNVFDAITIIASAYGIRAILMIFGR